MKVRADRLQLLPTDETHTIPVQTHRFTRGHQAHLDVTEHRDPNTLVVVEFEVSTDNGKTWQPGGGFTRQGGGNSDRWVSVCFGHEPTPKHRDWRGVECGSDPAPHRLVRGTMRVIRTPPEILANQQFHVASVPVAHPAPGLAALFTNRPIAPIRTRVHVVGTAGVSIDESLIPID